MAKSDFDIEENDEFEQEPVNNKKSFLKNKSIDNIKNPEIVYDENTYNAMIEEAMKNNRKISERKEKFTRFGEETAEEIELFINKFKK